MAGPPLRARDQARRGGQAKQASSAGDWAPELLDAILSSTNTEAHDALLRAAFAAGPTIVPQLEAALQDDRTAEFAAQSLAFIGGGKAIEILRKLVSDPRDLNLRRLYYGALAEYTDPEATTTLLQVIVRSDAEPDRTVTEAAILALTVRSDQSLVLKLREVRAKIHDVAIRDDLESAVAIIEHRARLSPAARGPQASVEQAVRTYFAPALGPPPAAKTPGQLPPPHVSVKIENLTFSPEKTRALARVIFEDSSAQALYDMALKKGPEGWAVASVWLNAQAEKTPRLESVIWSLESCLRQAGGTVLIWAVTYLTHQV